MTLRRFIYAFLLAVILAVILSIANDVHAATTKPTKPITTQDDIVVEPTDISPCKLLEPYGWWWFFFDCASK